MRSRKPDESIVELGATDRALDEFATEDLQPAESTLAKPVDRVLSFDCTLEPEATRSTSGALLDIAPADAPGSGAAQPLSRLEAVAARRRYRRRSPLRKIAARVAAVHAGMAHARRTVKNGAQDAWHRSRNAAVGLSARSADAAARLDRRSKDAASRLSQRTWPLVREGRRAAHRLALRALSRGVRRANSTAAQPQTALEHQEFNGSVVAVAVAVAAVGYAAFLGPSWRTSTTDGLVAVTGAPPPGPVPAIRVAGPSSMPATASPIAHTVVPPVERPAFTPTARTLTTLWQRRDTRSLEQAFATLRRDTLAFHRCGLRVTEADRAVARCEGIAAAQTSGGAPASRPATWTIDFQRTAGRWAITRVATR